MLSSLAVKSGEAGPPTGKLITLRQKGDLGGIGALRHQRRSLGTYGPCRSSLGS